MNQKEIKTFNEMKNVMESIAETVKNIDVTLNGKKGDRHDLGLVGDVRNNVKWRNTVQKWMGILGISVIGLVAKDIWKFIKGI